MYAYALKLLFPILQILSLVDRKKIQTQTQFLVYNREDNYFRIHHYMKNYSENEVCRLDHSCLKSFIIQTGGHICNSAMDDLLHDINAVQY